MLTWSPGLAEVDQEAIIQMRPLTVSWPADLDEEDFEDLVDIMDEMEMLKRMTVNADS